MFKILALLLCCCVLASAKRAQRIRHGREVTTSEAKGVFGFMAHVSMCRGRGCGSCTGSLIGPDKVLIAAHCVCRNPNRITVSSSLFSTALIRRFALIQKTIFTVFTCRFNSLAKHVEGTSWRWPLQDLATYFRSLPCQLLCPPLRTFQYMSLPIQYRQIEFRIQSFHNPMTPSFTFFLQVYLQTTRAWKGRMAKARIYKRANYNCGGRGYTSDQDVALLKLDQRITDITPVRLECGT